MESLPVFEKYNVAEFDAWVEAYTTALRRRHEGKWWEEGQSDQLLAYISKRAEVVRQRMADGELTLRPMPPPGKMPSYAEPLESYLTPPAPIPPNTEAGRGNGGRDYRSLSYDKRQATVAEPVEPHVLCVPFQVASAPEDSQDLSSFQKPAGRPPKDKQQIISDWMEVKKLLDNKFTIEGAARKLRLSPRTIHTRRDRYEALQSSGSLATEE